MIKISTIMRLTVLKVNLGSNGVANDLLHTRGVLSMAEQLCS